jgi:hypothetical protein
MRHLDRPVVVWAVLVVITLASVALAELSAMGPVTYLLVFGAAAFKGQLVAVYFMETPRALPVWNGLYRIWIVAIGAVLWAGIAFSA